MTATSLLSDAFRQMAEGPAWLPVLLKATALLAAAWVVHHALARANPRWRVLLWRGVAVGLAALPLLSWTLPSMEVPLAIGDPAAGEPPLLSSSNRAPGARAAAALPGGEPAGNPGTVVTTAPSDATATPPPNVDSYEAPGEERRAILAAAAASGHRLGYWALGVTWLAGIGLLSLRLGVGQARLRQVIRAGREPPDWVILRFAVVARALRLAGWPRIVRSAEVASPLLCGLRRRVLLLPSRMCKAAYRPDLRGIFAHEVTHLQSRDLLWNALLHGVSMALWFHPLAWRLRKAHLAACDLVCDAVSAGFVGDAGRYSRTLARVAVEAATGLSVPGIAMARRSDVMRRLSALRRKVFDLPLRRRRVLAFALVVLLGVAFVGVLKFVRARPDAPLREGGPLDVAAWFDDGPVSVLAGQTEPLSVMVRAPDGQPATGAEIRIADRRQTTFVINGAFAAASAGFTAPRTDGEGRFSIEPPPINRLPRPAPFRLAVLHERGYAWATDEELAQNPEIALQPWGRLEGSIRRGTAPWPGLEVSLRIDESIGPSNFVIGMFEYRAETDANGSFAFPRVRPGSAPLNIRSAQAPFRPFEQVRQVQIAAGQTLKVTFGGVGRPVVGRVEWPAQVRAQIDPARVHGSLTPDSTVVPPKDVQAQGPDAWRAWMDRWAKSDEGKAHREEELRRLDDLRSFAVGPDGSFRVENVAPGRHRLLIDVELSPADDRIGRRQSLRASREVTVAEVAGGVTDEPLDLGVLKAEPGEGMPPPAGAQALLSPAQAKSVGYLRDYLDLLRAIAAEHQQNLDKIQTWQGRAAMERRVQRPGMPDERERFSYRFVFDRARRSVRWNRLPEDGSRPGGEQASSAVAVQIVNEMRTPEAIYQFPDSPGRRESGPRTLTILSRDQERMVPRPYVLDLDPRSYLLTPRGNLANDLASYVEAAENPYSGRVKVQRDGDLVIFDTGPTEGFNRHTISLSQGCNPVVYDAIQEDGTWQYRWTWEKRDGVWLPASWSETERQPSRSSDCKVTFAEHVVNRKLPDDAFSLASLGLQPGDEIHDMRTQKRSKYLGR